MRPPSSANQEIELWPSTLNTLNYFRARGSTVQSLSGREREILVLLGQGKDAASIATKLGLSGGTVRTHVRHIREKLKVKSSTEAVAKYLNPSE
jgi:two-component system NarL family response regulator